MEWMHAASEAVARQFCSPLSFCPVFSRFSLTSSAHFVVSFENFIHYQATHAGLRRGGRILNLLLGDYDGVDAHAASEAVAREFYSLYFCFCFPMSLIFSARVMSFEDFIHSQAAHARLRRGGRMPDLLLGDYGRVDAHAASEAVARELQDEEEVEARQQQLEEEAALRMQRLRMERQRREREEKEEGNRREETMPSSSSSSSILSSSADQSSSSSSFSVSISASSTPSFLFFFLLPPQGLSPLHHLLQIPPPASVVAPSSSSSSFLVVILHPLHRLHPPLRFLHPPLQFLLLYRAGSRKTTRNRKK